VHRGISIILLSCAFMGAVVSVASAAEQGWALMRMTSFPERGWPQGIGEPYPLQLFPAEASCWAEAERMAGVLAKYWRADPLLSVYEDRFPFSGQYVLSVFPKRGTGERYEYVWCKPVKGLRAENF
jgi:hypothetical protein